MNFWNSIWNLFATPDPLDFIKVHLGQSKIFLKIKKVWQ